jgi:hypothetical protein
VGGHVALELEHHPVGVGVAAGPDVDEGWGRLGPGGRGRQGKHDGGETGDDEGPDEPHGDHLFGKLLARASTGAVTARMRACIRAVALPTRIGHGEAAAPR